jgi:hypothetical protein
MADQGAQAQQGDGGETTEAQQGPDFQAVVEQLGSMAQGQEEMRQALAGLPELLQGQQQGEQPGQEEALLDPSMLDFENPQFDPNQAAQGLQGWVEQQWQQREQQLMEQHVNPLRQQLGLIQQTGEARDLVAEFPELGEEETARSVVTMAQQLAEGLGAPQLAGHPQMWRLAYLAGRAMEAAQQEGGEEPRPAHLEGGGGAGPAGGSQPDLKQQILDASKGSSVLPFG